MSGDSEDKSQKTEQPTPHRLEKSQEKGQFPISKEVSHGLMLIAFTACFFLIFPTSFKKLMGILQKFMQDTLAIQEPITDMQPLCQQMIQQVALLFVLPALLLFFTAFMAGLSQTQFQVSLKSIKPSLEKLSIIKGLGRIFSLKSLIDFFKSFLKFVMIATVTFWVLGPRLWEFVNYPSLDMGQQLDIFNGLFLKLVFSIIIMIFVLAIIDFFYERWMYLRNLRMSKQEIKDEQKELDGDPHIKGRLRQLRMERAKRRVAEQIPEATVIITNPTHYAIALKYAWGHEGAPLVLTKGVDYLALKIREIAKDHNIPIIENPPLARALYKGAKEGKEIPGEYYEAVANIIRYVYDLKNPKKIIR